MVKENQSYLVAGLMLTAVGITVLDNAPWILQYSAMGLGVAFLAFSLYQETSESSKTD